MKNPAKVLDKLQGLWNAGLKRPLAVIVVAGSVSVFAYVMFAVLPFFIPNVDKSHFPPYLALPETGGELSSYYLLYMFIGLNAMAIFGLYLFALRATGAQRSARLTRYIFSFSILFHLLMLMTPFLLSTDVFDYIRHGRILAIYGENPLVVPATYFPEDPFFGLGGWVGTGSVYGSLHVYVVAFLVRIAGDSLTANFFLFKGFFVGLNIVNLGLIWKITRRLRPGLENKALLFYGWNPFILTLVVANAHNDILMLTLVLAGFLMYLDRRFVPGILCLALATLVKFITLPILLVFVALAVRQQRGLGRRVALGTGTLGMSAAVFVLSYLPLWAGRETFGYLTTIGQKTNFTISALIRDAAASHIDLSLSNSIVQFSLAALLIAYLVWHIFAVRDAGELLSAAAGLAFLTPLVLFWFQPWYLTLALGLVALRPRRLMFLASLAFSFSVMFFDSFWWHAPVSMDIQKPMRVLVVFGPPVALLLVLKGRELIPVLWRKLISWSLGQTDENRATQPEAAILRSGNLSDPSPLRLIVEISLLVMAAIVPMAVVVSTSPQLRSLAELVIVKLQLLIG